ncbi:hypothetical protein KWH19_03030 [Xanthomonas campestris pv. pennamericanum]|uniref:hypothetical protein n=1 Tax=Xanthomonas euvesicatoria TaxID=456327 RepID=UPI001C44C045|nr:hypothetical protein [Xanthomonas euvesicatoria]MBV6808817.1 hypothetical protein [Xanthomonas campestris pv. pennamericanum]
MLKKFSATFIALLSLAACSEGPSTPSPSSASTETPQSATTPVGPTPFEREVERVQGVLSCRSSKITPASDGWGALYGCIGGQAETVKFFIDEEQGAGSVKSVKFLWNDWFKDRGYGLHADAKDADKMAHDLIKLYPSEHDSALLKAFKGKKNLRKEGGGYRFEYTYDRGPAIDERMIVVTPLPPNP